MADDNIKKSTFLKGLGAFRYLQGKYLEIKVKPDSRWSIIDKASGDAIVRFDRPHKGYEYSHININKKFSGVPDPHIPLPPGGLTVTSRAALFCKRVNDVLFPVIVVVDTAHVAQSVYKDYKEGTTTNTVETIAEVTGGYTGGYGGAFVGAVIGTKVFPGVGTIIGGLCGGIYGGVMCASAAKNAAKAIMQTETSYSRSKL